MVLSSPSGAGKTSLSHALLAQDEDITLSISATTRPPRPSEQDGVDYHFISEAEFDIKQANGDFLESAKVFEHYYGTPRAPVDTLLEQGRDVLFDIDWQGTQQLQDSLAADVVDIFILPPNAHELEKRLIKRAQDNAETVARRMAKANDEISHYAEYDYVIINRDFDQSLADIKAILCAERLRRKRQSGLSDFIRMMQTDLETINAE